MRGPAAVVIGFALIAILSSLVVLVLIALERARVDAERVVAGESWSSIRHDGPMLHGLYRWSLYRRLDDIDRREIRVQIETARLQNRRRRGR